MATPTSMFGMSPLDVVQQRIQEQEKMNMLRRQQRSQEGSEFGVFAPLYRAGLGFGDIAGQALTQSVFGQQQDPMLKKAVDIQSVLSGRDVTKPEDLSAIASELAKMGYGNEAAQVAQQARTAGLEERKLAIQERQVRGKDDVLSVLTKDGRPAVYDSETNTFKVPDKETGALRAFDPKKDQLEYKQSAGDPMSTLIASIVANSMGLGGKQPGTPKPPTTPKADDKKKPTAPLDPNAYKM
jgi:hypothetical protein